MMPYTSKGAQLLRSVTTHMPIIPPDTMPTLTDVLIAAIVERLTHPLPEGWHVAFPLDVRRMTCACGAPIKFVRIIADDCDTWGLRGIDGAHSDAYGIYCPDCN